MNIDYDVCIIGSGPCGLTVALELNKIFRVCIVELAKNLKKENVILKSATEIVILAI